MNNNMTWKRFGFVAGALALAMAPAFAETKLNAAGATFPQPIYEKWFAAYHEAHPDVTINYQGTGSGAGITAITSGTVDFAASDAIMSADQIKAFSDKNKTEILHFPTVLGGVVLIYNIPGVTEELNLTGEVIANIYLGKIAKWNDPALKSLNPKVNLPDAEIVSVHRADASGTSYIFADYLGKVSPAWKSGPGVSTSPTWVSGGMAQPKNAGVASVVKQTPNSIGYVELIYALSQKLTHAKVKNAAGNFVAADLKSVSEAANGVEIPADFRVSITDAKGKGAYPISSFTWLLIPEKFTDPAKGKVVKDFLTWMLTTGQTTAESASFAKLPEGVVKKEKAAIAKIQ